MRTLGSSRTSLLQRPQGLGNALIRLQISECANQRRALVESQQIPCGLAVRLRNPGPVRDRCDRPREPLQTRLAPTKSLCAITPREFSSSRRVIAMPS